MLFFIMYDNSKEGFVKGYRQGLYQSTYGKNAMNSFFGY